MLTDHNIHTIDLRSEDVVPKEKKMKVYDDMSLYLPKGEKK